MKTHLFFCLTLYLFFNCFATQAATKLWNGGNGNWNVSGNWLPTGIPAVGDDVQILSGNPIVDANSKCNSLNTYTTTVALTGGTLTVTTSISVLLGTLTFSGAKTVSCTGITVSTLTGLVNAAVISCNGDVAVGYISSITNNSTGNFTINGDLALNFLSSLTNNSSGVFTINGDISSGGTTIDNYGSLNYNAGTYTTNNSDVVTNHSGGTCTFNGSCTVDLSAGGTVSNSGTFYAGTSEASGTSCVINLGNYNSSLTNATGGVFYVGSTSGISFVSNGTYNSNTSGVLINNGTFTVQSDAYGSGSIGRTGATATGVIKGTYNVQRFVQGNNSTSYRGYRLMTSPVNTSGLLDLSYLPNSTIVTGATCTGCITTGNPTIYLYNETLPVLNTSFVSGNFLGVTKIATTTTTISTLSKTVTTTTSTVPYGNGYFLFFRGDKTTNAANKTVPPFAAANNVTFTASGALNQGNIAVKLWFNGSTTLSNTNSNAAAKGFNLVGNPYACSIDWEKVGSGITATNLNNTIYIFNTVKKNYSTYVKGSGGIGTNMPNSAVHNANIIPSGQGFFVKVGTLGTTPGLTFTEAAKSTTFEQQTTASNLMLASAPVESAPKLQYFRLQLKKDSVSDEDALVFLKKGTSTAYVLDEDGPYLKSYNGLGLSTRSSDHMDLAVNALPFPKQSETIGLNANVNASGNYQLNMTEVQNIPDLFSIWLMDAYKKDSLDIKHNPSYTFTANISDTASYGANRFSVVIRENPLNNVHLLSFTATKVQQTVKLDWTAEHEDNYTRYVIERSNDGGKTFSVIDSLTSAALEIYSDLDQNPLQGQNIYRLKQIDFFGNVTYSNSVIVSFGATITSTAGGPTIYPNPVKDVINLNINPKTLTKSAYQLRIFSSNSTLKKTFITGQDTWQGNVGDLEPGVYILEIRDNTTKNTIGVAKFSKL